MSFYSNFCGKGKARQFLVIINEHGEMGVAALDENGKPASWAFGETRSAVQSMLRQVHPEAIVTLSDYKTIKDATNYAVMTPEECCDALNGKQCAKRRLLKFLERWTTRLGKFVDYDREAQEYRPKQMSP